LPTIFLNLQHSRGTFTQTQKTGSVQSGGQEKNLNRALLPILGRIAPFFSLFFFLLFLIATQTMSAYSGKEEQPITPTGSEGYRRGSSADDSLGGEKLYHCSWQGCDYKSTQIGNLMAHIRNHHRCVKSRASEGSS
jgi:hypothetical protein